MPSGRRSPRWGDGMSSQPNASLGVSQAVDGLKVMRRRTFLVLTAVSVSSLGLAACGSGDGNQAPTPYAFPGNRPGVKDNTKFY